LYDRCTFEEPKTQRPPKRRTLPLEGLILALSDKPLSLEFTPFEDYIYGNDLMSTNKIKKVFVKKNPTLFDC